MSLVQVLLIHRYKSVYVYTKHTYAHTYTLIRANINHIVGINMQLTFFDNTVIIYVIIFLIFLKHRRPVKNNSIYSHTYVYIFPVSHMPEGANQKTAH